MWNLLNAIYGDARGYDRLRIRRTVASNASRSQADLLQGAADLFQLRVRAALEQFPAYRTKVEDHCGSLPKTGSRVSPAHLPVWTRDDQRAFFAATPGPPLRKAFVNRTGGSTGVPLKYWVTRDSWEWRTAVSDRGYGWAGAQKGVRSVYVWGSAIHPPGWAARWKGKISGALQNRVFFDSFAFGEEEKTRCCRTINRVKPRALVGYAGNLVELACFVRSHPGLLAWKSPCLVTAAEGISEVQRALFRDHLADDVFASYGSREFMLIGMECGRHNGYHLSADNLFVEVVDADGAPLPPGELGRILITDLRNHANPFIRYEIGDLGRLAPPAEPCPCGLPFPRLLRVEGRSQEFIELPGGQRLTALFIPHLMKEFEWVQGYQVVQKSADRITIRLITAAAIEEERVLPLREKLLERVGADMRIDFSRVAQLQKNASGKTPIVISKIEIE